ncbi:TauD/TfdA family dioxygenase [Verticiella sediminum]|uniref:TauD/TfdA family dioxygenase n=1 Tax=Verticiella sediminum TaxID=1247510 RepID=A0A556AJE1_9BURK|nr:TauD/TfdA family dioxygenase [Verticiella sediminum]TSH92993.1 TauD/TfdA family dioxygenase [Verticiella sediminum]
MAAIEIRPVTGGCGVELRGVRLDRALDEDTLATIRQAYTQYGVVFFRDQDITPAQHLAFARSLGDIVVNRFFIPVEGHPEIATVNKGEFDTANIGGDWHTDHSYDQIPAMGSILVARELPAYGGDTLFANLSLAFKTLSPGLQRTLMGLKAVHSAEHVFGRKSRAAQLAEQTGKAMFRNADAAEVEAVHPVVIAHPVSGEPVLYVNPIFTLRFEGWTDAESKPLLDYLYRHASRPEHTCRYTWRPGSIAMWDNRSTWHYAANDYHGQRRLMHRITLDGCALQAYAGAAGAEAAA